MMNNNMGNMNNANYQPPPKNKGCLKTLLIVIIVFVSLMVLVSIFASTPSNTDTAPSGASTAPSTSSQREASKQSKGDPEEIFAQAQELYDQGKYIQAVAEIDKAIAIEADSKYEEFKTVALNKIEERKAALEAQFQIKDDPVENITFISPVDTISQGLILYPYIGVKESRRYILLRVGYQEPVGSSLFVFTKIKVRVGDNLEELKFNPMNKRNNVDVWGSGMTEVIDISVDKKMQSLLESIVAEQDNAIVRFEDISNQTSDYTISVEQKQTIADVLEYFEYLDYAK